MKIQKFNEALLDEEVLLLAKVSSALGHPLRIRIFQFIMKKNSMLQNVSNQDVVKNFDYAQSTISQHIKTLVKSGLVQVKKVRTYSYYYANIGLHNKYAHAVQKFIKQ